MILLLNFQILDQRLMAVSEIPHLHLYRAAMGNIMHAIFVLQQYVLVAHSSLSVDIQYWKKQVLYLLSSNSNKSSSNNLQQQQE